MTLAAMYGLPVIINEYDRIEPGRTIVFNDVFEGRTFPIPGRSGVRVTPREGFRPVITANTNMVEDVSGNYGTASSHDTSLLERLFLSMSPIRQTIRNEKFLEKCSRHLTMTCFPIGLNRKVSR